MKKVFVGGSRRLSRLNNKVTQTLDRLIERELTIIIGDANGADKAVQSYLSKKQYRNVIVFCMRDHCRNNLGNWENRQIVSDQRFKNFDYYATKDLAMANETDYGFMLWDSESKGTLNNIVNLLTRNKQVVVYFSPKKNLYQLNDINDISKLLSKCDYKTIRGFESILKSTRLNRQPEFWNKDSEIGNLKSCDKSESFDYIK
jgi:hypothetical protein